MLPISRHRALVIPHRLALIAAAVCLALAFFSGPHGVDGPMQAQHGTPGGQPEGGHADAAVISRGEPCPGPARSAAKPSLLPWFSGLMR